MINKRIVSPDSKEDFSYLKSTSMLSTSVNYMDVEDCMKELKNITLVPRSGTHNNFKIKEEIIIYIIGGDLLYSDSTGNLENLSSGDFLYINSLDGITYDIFNNGTDFLDIIEITLVPQYAIKSKKFFNKENSFINLNVKNPVLNQWIYAVSSLNGLAPIKSTCDINIYSACLDADKSLNFTVGKERHVYLFQCYGESEITASNLESITLTGAGSAYISNENFEIRATIPSNILLIETINL